MNTHVSNMFTISSDDILGSLELDGYAYEHGAKFFTDDAPASSAVCDDLNSFIEGGLLADEAWTQITAPPRTGDDPHYDDHSIFDLDIATMSDAAFTATDPTAVLLLLQYGVSCCCCCHR